MPNNDGLTTWDLLTDERSRTGVEVAERFTRDEATEEELKIAEKDAENARRAHSNAAPYDDHSAAYAAGAVTNVTCIRHDAASYDNVAAYNSYSSHITSTVRIAARKAQADYLKTLIPNPFL